MSDVRYDSADSSIAPSTPWRRGSGPSDAFSCSLMPAVRNWLTPQSDGWFVVNAGEAAWLVNDGFGARCVFEADTPVVRGSGFAVHRFPQLGITLAVLEPGTPSGLYHHETNQEDFLVLTGECL